LLERDPVTSHVNPEGHITWFWTIDALLELCISLTHLISSGWG
jgi:hypothetical protein